MCPRLLPVLLPLASDQEASCIPAGAGALGFPKFRAAWNLFSLVVPFLPLGPHVGYLMALWTVCIRHTVTSLHPELPIEQRPLGLAPGRGPKRPQLSGSYWKNPLCPVEQEVPSKFKSVISCHGLCRWRVEQNGCGCVKGKEM